MNTSISRDSLMAAFGENPMVLPDGIVHGTNAADWPVVLDALSRAGWPARWNSPDPGPDTPVDPRDFDEPSRHYDSFAVHPAPGVRVNFFWYPGEVVFDIDLRELRDQASVDGVCALMIVLGEATGRTVTLSQEGDEDAVVLRYDPGDSSFRPTSSEG